MVAHITPIFASARTAAKLLDMKEAEFLKLVGDGLLPPPEKIGGKIDRWEVDKLSRLASGRASLGDEFEW